MTPVDHPAWANIYLAGATLQEIADSENITREGVRQRLKRLGIAARSRVETRKMQQLTGDLHQDRMS